MLIICAMALWGVIVKKIFFSVSSPTAVSTQQNRDYEANIVNGDTLYLNYKEPFIIDAVDLLSQRSGRTATQAEKPAKIVLREEVAINMLGIIGVGQKKSYMFDIQGSIHMLLPGDTILGFKLIRIFSDSAHFSKRGNIYTAVINR